MTTSALNAAPRRRDFAGGLLATPAVLVVLFVIVLPGVQLVRYSFNHFDSVQMMQAAFTLENYVQFLTDPYYHAVLWTTIKVAALCTALSLVLGFPVAYVLAKTQSRFKSQLVMLLVFPLLVGNVVRAAGWMVMLGNAGFVNAMLMALGLVDQPVRLLYTPFAVVAGTTAVVLPYMILTLQSVLEGLDFSIEEAARNLGASFAQTLARVVLPIAAPGVAAGTMLVFILCMNAYATPVLLGGTGITMMTPAIYDQIAKANNWPFGAVLSIVSMVVTFALALLSHWIIQRRYAKTMMT
ncbi:MULTISPECIES: ABC transporter permease [Paraburkholderia]|uniref:Putative spermidine/putrescine transport system permease protein n=1 Tax=Paraburkholderia tuberum TaxID=157910 RepID=A0A1H1KA82_9BURK|nr:MULTISPECIES: ABC transporter permease [Paraburkholderia]MBB5413322.1 putative spermidine/putrescine transport system permease protein [Paraburkholderia sp. HC6.4b]MBB5455678.1 putative spermidine/putrescine transport system permease protein [Paraburkholderia sp. Kb1A]MBB5458051.1 putative spermidine/putrescine transport system permease protein [Paraburkholderia sp. Cpub6]SDR58917.1 putative spermidine/putrescine transport system permease protein [Paraburkholderia tuberum]